MAELDVVEQTDNELLNDEIEELEVPKSEETETEETETEEEEDKEDKDKVKEIDEDKPFPYERPSIQEIKEKYPTFFKDFPIFRDVVFREIEYTKMFPTIDDAKEAVEDNLAFDGLRDSVLQGKAEDLINAVDSADKQATEKLALNFLPALYKKDQNLYTTAVTPIFENLVRTFGRSSDENQRNAALVLAAWLWNEDDAEKIVKGLKTFTKSTEESEDAKKLREEREKDQTERIQRFEGDVHNEIRMERAKLILRTLDPDKSMTTSQKEMLVERIANLADKAMASDVAHMSVMNSRWQRSKKDGFNTESKAKIVAAYLARAKQVIPSIRDKERDAFFGVRRKVSEKKVDEIDRKSSTKEVTSGRVADEGNKGNNVSTLKPSKELYRKMSDLDILTN